MNSLAKNTEDDDESEKDSPIGSGGSEYPKLCLRDSQIKSFLDGTRLELDKEYEVTIRFTICGVSQNEYCKSLELDVTQSGDIVEVGESESAEAKDPILMAVGSGSDSESEDE
jgi:hypothetical protein